MSFAFDRPIGSHGDVTELDYIAALHQTDVPGGLRKDGSIKDVDISLFLSSRYGVSLSPEEINEKILTDLGSTDGFMDMMQLVSLLMIPVLREQQEERLNAENDSVHNLYDSQKDDLLMYTVEMLLHDVTGSRQPKALTATLIRQILQGYGEEALAQNEDLVKAMLEQAGDGHHRRVILDSRTFCRALTADVQEFDVHSKNKMSTNYDDVMGDPGSRGSEKPANEMDDAESSDNLKASAPSEDVESITIVSTKSLDDDVNDIPTIPTAPQIDYVTDTFRSKPLVLCQWTFFVFSFQTYLTFPFNQWIRHDICPKIESGRWGENNGAFFCMIGMNVVKWIIIMLAMSVVGLIYFYIGGIGNDIECINPKYPAIGTFIMLLCTLLPPYLFKDYGTGSIPREYLVYMTGFVGSCATLVTFWHFIVLLMPTKSRWREWFKYVLVPEGVRTESYIKEAADYKINNMVRNALEVHRIKKQETVVPTHFGQALLNFAELAPKFERIGGFFWTLRSMRNLSLFRREGVFFSGRLISTNFMQLIVTLFILVVGLVVTTYASNAYDRTVGAVGTLLEFLLVVDVSATRKITEFIEEWVVNGFVSIFGGRYIIVVPLSVGFAIAFISSFLITAVVLPSASTTTLQFRSGVLAFVHDPRVLLLRRAPDHTAFLRGYMYWGCLWASLLFGLFSTVGTFFCLWPVTAVIFQGITASILGAVLVLLVHVLVSLCVRKASASAYYRSKPKVSNIAVLVRECGLVALSQGFVWLRILKLGITTLFYIGRLDSPLLYKGLGEVGIVRIDNGPYLFQIEILQHEAHRHPYIETLGVMYLLKLRHQRSFGNMAGSCWRLIFVYVLMPWLSKYRAVRRLSPAYKGDDDEETVAPPVSRPLRALTLLDPQAYALRSVSLVPVASCCGGSLTASRLSVLGDGCMPLVRGNQEDEVRELREEVEYLRNQLQQLRLTNLSTAKALPSRDVKPTRGRPSAEDGVAPALLPPSRSTREVKPINKPGFDIDSRGRLIPRSPKQTVEKATGIARNEEDANENPRRCRPNPSDQGLSILRLPARESTRNEGADISCSDFDELPC